MKKIIIALVLLVAIATNSTELHAKREKPPKEIEQKQNKKQERINSAHELLKTHSFCIREYSYDYRVQYTYDKTILYIDINNPQRTKLISENLDNNKYTLVITGLHQRFNFNCIFKISLDLNSGILEIRYYHHHGQDPTTINLDEKGRGKRIFTGDYSNIRPLDNWKWW